MVLRKFGLTALLWISFVPLWGATVAPSAFVPLQPGASETRMLEDPSGFPLADGLLIAGGVREENLPEYQVRISNFMAVVSPMLTNPSPTEQAKVLFQEMHRKLLKKYDPYATTLDVLLKTGRFNCLSATSLYYILLTERGFSPKGVQGKTHIYLTFQSEGRDILVETIAPFGFDLESNPDAAANIFKLTGFEVGKAGDATVALDKAGLFSAVYANSAVIASKASQSESAFRNAWKAYKLFPEADFTRTNLITAYSEYGYSLVQLKRDLPGALSLLEEGLSYFPRQEILQNNAYSILDRQLSRLVENGQYAEATNTYRSAAAVLGANPAIEENLYTGLLFRMVSKDNDFPSAYALLKQALLTLTNSKNLDSIYINGLHQLSRNTAELWQLYPQGEDLLLSWYRLKPNPQAFELLEDYYTEVAIRHSQSNNPDRGILVTRNGLAVLTHSEVLKKNGVVIAGNAANAFFQTNDLESGVKYTRIGLEFDPQNETLRQNVLATYRNLAAADIEKENFRRAMTWVKSGLELFPDDKKLLYYKQYLEKKLK